VRRRNLVFAAVVLGGLLLVASMAVAGGGKKNLKADELSGYQENPDVSTVAAGSFDVELDDSARTLTYELAYTGLEGNVLQAHIHFGKRAVNGGVTVFLCGTATNPGPAGTPACPTPGGTVRRTVQASEILAPATGSPAVPQGIEAGNYEELAAALRSGHAYANVHSTKWPGGEIRAQINDKDQKD
jgi:hypothetical protein